MTAVVFPRTLHAGDTGEDVTAVKRALIKWNHGDEAGVAVTPNLGAAADKLLAAFQHAELLQADGVYGPATHSKLAPFFDLYGASLMKAEKKQLDAAARPRNRFLQIADLTVQHQSLFTYTMALGDSPGERGYFRLAPLDWARRYWCDCSQHYIGCGKHAGLGGVFNTDGATGALLTLDHITLTDAQPGDGVVFTGPGAPDGVHITILRARLPGGDWRVINMGGPEQPKYGTLSGEESYHASIGAGTEVVVRLPA